MTAFDFLFKDEKPLFRKGADISREKFLSYPKHLKTTLFLDDPKLERIRKIEFMQRYMVIDEIRESGNEFFFKGNYGKAIGTYTTAYACLKWLQFIDPDSQKDEEATESLAQDDSTLDQSLKKIDQITAELSDDLKSKIKIDLTSIAERSFKMQKSTKESKLKDPKLRLLTAIFDDENTSLHIDNSLSCEHDVQMRRLASPRRQPALRYPRQPRHSLLAGMPLRRGYCMLRGGLLD